jgi:N-acetylmuramoyl-L-alanine amidase
MSKIKNFLKLHLTPILILLVILLVSCEVRAEDGYFHSCEYPDRQTELTALACNVYFEARGESRAGKIAVALVTLNRRSSERFPDDIKNVVYQNRQFSWYSDGITDKVYDLKAWNNALHIAIYVLGIDDKDYPYVDITDGSLFYHSVKVSPNWAYEGNIMVRIDNHLFYKKDVKR